MPGGNKPSITDYNRVLKVYGVYANDIGKRIDKIANFRAEAAHGKPTGLTKGGIVNHVNFLRKFFVKYPYKVSLSAQIEFGPPSVRAKLRVSPPTE